jgi:hypothetical protein
MKKLLFAILFLSLLWPREAPGQQTAVGYYVQNDCDTINFRRDNAVICIQIAASADRPVGEYRWTGTGWIKSDGAYVQASQPSTCHEGETWWDTTNNVMMNCSAPNTWSAATAGSAGHQILINGVPQVAAPTLNFQGAFVAPGGGPPGTNVLIGPSLLDEAAAITLRGTWKFTGAGITLTDSGTENVITVPGGSTDVAADYAWTGLNSYLDGKFSIMNSADPTKIMKWDLSNITAKAVRTYQLPDATTKLWGASDFAMPISSLTFAVPAQFSITGSPAVTNSSTLTLGWNNQNANTALRGPQTGAAAAPTFRTAVKADMAPLVVFTDQSNVYSGGDQDCGACASETMPKATGANPTQDARYAFDLTARRFKVGDNGTARAVAWLSEIQPLNSNLTVFSGLTGAANGIAMWTAPGAMSVSIIPDCVNAGGNVLHKSGVIWTCDQSASGLSGGVPGQVLQANSANTFGSTAQLKINGAVVEMPGGSTTGDCSVDCVTHNTAAWATHGAWTLTWPYVGGAATVAVTTGAKVNGNAAIFGANGQIVDSGAPPGIGTVTLAGAQALDNKTIIDSLAGGTNTIKTLKAVQLQPFDPSENTATTVATDNRGWFRVPAALNTHKVIGVEANVSTPGTTGVITVQVVRCAATGSGNPCSGVVDNILSTAMTIDSGENSTSTAATPAVVDATKNTLSTGQMLAVVVTGIHTTPAKGLLVNLDIQNP